MATAREVAILRYASRVLLFVALAVAATASVNGQSAPGDQAAPLSSECQVAGVSASGAPTPRLAKALQEKRPIRVLSIGASAYAGWEPKRGGYQRIIEAMLEKTFKGLDVQIIDRGFSGELAKAVADRLDVEVALTHPDVVIWQTGTADAMARIPVEEFKETLTDMVRWLKAHDTDVVLIGLQYARGVESDAHYQALRRVVKEVADAEKVLRIGRYEAMEIIDRARKAKDQSAPPDIEIAETGYACMAEFVARAISVALFAKRETK
jgi:lysophospholipase L1-like esterase